MLSLFWLSAYAHRHRVALHDGSTYRGNDVSGDVSIAASGVSARSPPDNRIGTATGVARSPGLPESHIVAVPDAASRVPSDATASIPPSACCRTATPEPDSPKWTVRSAGFAAAPAT